MSWGPSKAPLRALFAAALLATGTAALADILVVRSTGPSAKSFPPGKRLPEGSRIVLKANDSLDLLDGRGTRTLRGPGTFVAGASAGRVAGNVPVTQRRARIGAVRSVGGGGELRPPSIWHVDVSKSSAFCVAEPNKVALWRSDASGPATLNIMRASGGPATRVDWEAGSSTVAWPSSLAIADNSEFRLSAGAAAPTSIKFRILPQRPVGLEDMASFLMSNQCSAQLDLFIETVRLPDDAPPAG